ncbi:MAG: ATP-binding protein [Nitrospinota bacterium]
MRFVKLFIYKQLSWLYALYFTPSKSSTERKTKFRINLITVLSVFTLLVILWLSSYEGDLETPISNDLAIALALNFLIILILVLLVILSKRLWQLYFEYKQSKASSTLQSKLVLSFLAMTLTPTILMFMVASGLLSETVDKWINDKIGDTMGLSLKIADRVDSMLVEKSESLLKFLTTKLAKDYSSLEQTNNDLEALLHSKLEEYNIDIIHVYNSSFKLISNVSKLEKPLDFDFKSGEEMIIKQLKEGSIARDIVELDRGIFAITVADVKSTGSLPAKAYIMVIQELDEELFSEIQNILHVFTNYKQLLLQKDIIKATYYLTLAIVGLVIILAAILVGIQLSNGIVIPLRRLSAATKLVAQGNLSVRIEQVRGNDEVGQLVTAFNVMTEDLAESEVKIKNAHNNLVDSNIELEHANRYVETVLNNIGAGVISVDKRGVITTINKSAGIILNIDPVSVKDQRYNKVLDENSLRIARLVFKDVRLAKKARIEKDAKLTINGRVKTLKIIASLLLDDHGHYSGAVLVLDDLTELITARRAEAIKDLSRVLAHEIKNPLTPIQLNAQRMKLKFENQSPDFPKVFHDATNTIIQEVAALKLLVEKFSDLAKATDQPGIENETETSEKKVAPLSFINIARKPSMLHDVIWDVINLYKDIDKNIKVKTNFDSNITMVKLDVEQFKRALINIIENAFDSMKGLEGVITIQTKKVSKNRARIEIADQGRGILTSLRKQVFTRYFSTKPTGAGLGLAIVNDIIEDHDGQIKVLPNGQVGTIFRISIPIN